MRHRVFSLATAITVLTTGLASQTAASELVYRPVNPGFGGVSSNYNYLIGLADIQNQHKPEGGGAGGVPIIDFPDIDIDLGGTAPTTTAPTTSSPTTFSVNNN